MTMDLEGFSTLPEFHENWVVHTRELSFHRQLWRMLVRRTPVENRLTDSRSPQDLQDTIHANEEPKFLAVKQPSDRPRSSFGQCILLNPAEIGHGTQKCLEIFCCSVTVHMGMCMTVPSNYADV
jgi:hypothetical protein